MTITEVDVAAPAARRCVTCDTELQGPFCHGCGEAARQPELRLVPYLREAVGGAFDVDSRLWRTVRALVAEPGRLTAEHVRGRRGPWVGPLKLFLLANLVFFGVLELVGGFGTFTTRLEHHLTEPFYGLVARRLVEQHGPWGSAESMLYAQRFDEATPRFANSMVVVLVPLFALVFKALAPRRPYLHHVTFALHFMAYLLLVVTVLPFVITAVVRLAPAAARYVNGELPVAAVMLAILGVYVARAWRVAYGATRGASWLRALAAMVALMPVLVVYRMILFFAVYAAL